MPIPGPSSAIAEPGTIGIQSAILSHRQGLAVNATSCWITVPTSQRGISVIHELRIYDCVAGRLPDLLKRFETITLKIWQKHGIKQAGFWTTLIGENNQRLYYLLQWESLAEREQKWNAFASDPEWHSARAATEANGAIVAQVTNEILTPASFSAVK
jgi:hypothetical protein